MKFDLTVASDISEIPDSLIELITGYFDHIYDKETFNSYFFKKYINKPFLLWLSFEGRIIAFYSLFIHRFVYGGKEYLGGKPELNIVSKDFLRYCLDNKIKYNQIDPMKILIEKVFEIAQKNGVSFMYSWPNNIALGTYKRVGYNNKDIFFSVYQKIFSKKYIISKVNNPLFRLILNFMRITATKPIFTSLRLDEVKVFSKDLIDISNIYYDLQKRNGYSFFIKKDNDIINSRFEEIKFRKFIIHKGKAVIGYIVIKRHQGVDHIVDYCVDDRYISNILRLIDSDNADALYFRSYYNKTDNNKIQKPRLREILKMLFSGFIFIRNDKINLCSYYFNETPFLVEQDLFMGAFLSDYSV